MPRAAIGAFSSYQVGIVASLHFMIYLVGGEVGVVWCVCGLSQIIHYLLGAYATDPNLGWVGTTVSFWYKWVC